MRDDLPSGTVTFLFTDIEGSTRLLAESGTEGYAGLLGEHHRLCREAWAAHTGVEVDTAGDSFFVAFATASAAVAAAAAAQASLARGPIRVRMGLHTGTPLVVDGDYVGMDVHRAARIAAAGHGGQVLVSAATAALLDPGGLVDLGDHWFKDLAAPERVFQLGDGAFPPLKSLYRTNLPVPATSFLGRDRELAEVTALLRRDGARLVTLTGPGGTGKTRLALQAAAEASDLFSDGVFWVPLAPLRDPALVLSAVGQAVDVKEEPGRDLAATLATQLGRKRALVLLDNAEHLLPLLADVLASLLQGSMTVAFLVTSRERLQIAAENVFAVPELAAADGVELFITRAAAAGSAVEPSESVRRLCARLDHLPLALELAAARTALLSPEQLFDRLAHRLDLLKGGRDLDPRQQTLRATIEWSYDLLDPEEQGLLARLSVFAGGCTIEAAEEVCEADLDTLQSLLDKSLLRRRDTELGPRFWMLETVRQFADEQLALGTKQQVVASFADWAVSESERADLHLRGPEQLVWMSRLDCELDNLRAALMLLIERRDGDNSLRLLNPLKWHLARRGLLSEVRSLLELTLWLPSADQGQRARALIWLGSDLMDDRGIEMIREALSLARAVGDLRLEGLALETLALVPGVSSPDEAFALFEEAAELFDRAGADDDAARLAINRAASLLWHGRAEDALRAATDAVTRTRKQGNRHGIGVALVNAADALTRLERLKEAGAALLEATSLLREVGETTLHGGYCVGVAAGIAAVRSDMLTAARLIGGWDVLAERAHVILDAGDIALRATIVSDIAGEIGKEALQVVLAEGQAMDTEAVVMLVEKVARTASQG